MVSALDSGANGPGSSPGRGTALCSWARHFTLIVPLSTRVYKWVLANLLLGVTLRTTSTPSRRSRNNRDKLRPDGPLGSYSDSTLATFGSKGYLLKKNVSNRPTERSIDLSILVGCTGEF